MYKVKVYAIAAGDPLLLFHVKDRNKKSLLGANMGAKLKI